MMKHAKILWITRTALFIALLIVLQAVTAAFGNTIVTGSIVNLMLILSVMTCGIASGATVAVISPAAAKCFGIGPLWSLIPFIILGNLTLILLWHFIGNRCFGGGLAAKITAALVAAASKFSVLYFGIVQLAIPLFLNLPDPQANLIGNMFSIPQLFTALIGGGAAILILPVLKRAVSADRHDDASD